MPCTGASTQFCGAGNRISVYSLTASTTPVVVNNYANVTYLGCFANPSSARALNAYYTVRQNVQDCVSTCASAGFNMSAISVSDCYCGQQLTANTATATTCSTVRSPLYRTSFITQATRQACPNRSGNICGGTNVVSVYQTGVRGLRVTSAITASGAAMSGDISTRSPGSGVPATYFATSLTTQSFFYGCFADNPSSRLFSRIPASANPPLNTPQLCVDACAREGFAYAGGAFWDHPSGFAYQQAY